MNLTKEMYLDIAMQAVEAGRTNFDFGLYDFKTNRIYEANHENPGMRVFEKTITKFISGFGNKQAFFYQISIVPIK